MNESSVRRFSEIFPHFWASHAKSSTNKGLESSTAVRNLGRRALYSGKNAYQDSVKKLYRSRLGSKRRDNAEAMFKSLKAKWALIKRIKISAGPVRLPACLREFEARKFEARRHAAADQRPGARRAAQGFRPSAKIRQGQRIAAADRRRNRCRARRFGAVVPDFQRLSRSGAPA